MLDPCYQGTEVEELAGKLPCRVQWHPGFRLTVQEMARYPDYRGPEFIELARRDRAGRPADAARDRRSRRDR